MRLGLQDLDWKYVGAVLARQDDGAQVDFLRGFLAECKTWGTRIQVEQQFAAVNSELTNEECDALAMLSYREEAI